MWRRLRSLFPRFAGLVVAGLGGWILAANLVEWSYPAGTLAWILAAGACGTAGGTLYLLSFDGPDSFRKRPVRIAGWIGMVILAGLPTALTPVLLVLTALAIPTLLEDVDPNERMSTT